MPISSAILELLEFNAQKFTGSSDTGYAPFYPLLSSMTEMRRIIMSSPIKSCTLHPVPSFLVQEYVNLLLLYITRMVNSSLQG